MNSAKVLLFSAACVVVPNVLNAAPKDPYGPRGKWTKLVHQADVLKQLKATEKQAAELKMLKRTPDDNRKAIGDILDKKQIDLLKRLGWKAQGGYALFDAELSERLKINEDQNRKLAAAAETNATEHKKLQSFLRRARFRSREAMLKYIAKYRIAADKRLLDVLTEEQKKQHEKIITV